MNANKLIHQDIPAGRAIWLQIISGKVEINKGRRWSINYR